MIKIDELVMLINKNGNNRLKNPFKLCLFANAKIVENTT
jgi:hypothetical protein